MRFQILCLSGGGFLGLYTAAVLAELEARTGKRMSDCFDLFAGTSIGGIIALGLAAGKSAVDIRDAFISNGENIFPPRRYDNGISRTFRTFKNIKKPLYDPSQLRQTIDSIVGKDALMSDLLRPTVIPAVNLTKGGPKVFKTGHHQRFIIDWKLSIADVALATSAAPTYFPAHKIENQIFADGGLFANSPDMIALHEAELFLGANRSDVHVLSIGTTTTDFAISSDLNPNLGIGGWIKNQRLTDVIIGSQQSLTNDMMMHILNERYFRIDRRQADEQREILALDAATPNAIANLKTMAANSFAEFSGDVRLREFLDHQAPAFTFANAEY